MLHFCLAASATPDSNLGSHLVSNSPKNSKTTHVEEILFLGGSLGFDTSSFLGVFLQCRSIRIGSRYDVFRWLMVTPLGALRNLTSKRHINRVNGSHFKMVCVCVCVCFFGGKGGRGEDFGGYTLNIPETLNPYHVFLGRGDLGSHKI